MCVRDLRVDLEPLARTIIHHRDDSGRRIDAVIELSDGNGGAFKIKLGANQIEKVAKDLVAIVKFMEAAPNAKATDDALCDLGGLANFAYNYRENGVMVVPVAVLKQ